MKTERTALDEIAFQLQYQARTERELTDKLTAKGYEADEIGAAMEKAKGYGWVDDRQYARRMIETARTGTVKGSRSIRFRLKQKGVSEAIIEECVGEMDPQTELDKALRLCAAVMAKNAGAEKRRVREKCYRALASRGFEYDVISAAVSRALQAEEE